MMINHIDYFLPGEGFLNSPETLEKVQNEKRNHLCLCIGKRWAFQY